jgi:hypothetical protein
MWLGTSSWGFGALISSYADSIYPCELEINDTTVFHIYFGLGYLTRIIYADGKLTTQLYDKRDEFKSFIVSFPYLCSNIPFSPVSISWFSMQENVLHMINFKIEVGHQKKFHVKGVSTVLVITCILQFSTVVITTCQYYLSFQTNLKAVLSTLIVIEVYSVCLIWK